MRVRKFFFAHVSSKFPAAREAEPPSANAELRKKEGKVETGTDGIRPPWPFSPSIFCSAF